MLKIDEGRHLKERILSTRTLAAPKTRTLPPSAPTGGHVMRWLFGIFAVSRMKCHATVVGHWHV